MDTQDRQLYLQEVLELTELLNTEWVDLKKLLVENNINLEGAYMVVYLEGKSDGAEYGIILTADKKLIRFIAKDGGITLQELEDRATAEVEFPTIIVAMEL
ncbi:hypothetical protein [Chitinophaga sp. S165]|uniref:hypothetical protein n=1 Tax=Chitinophaga sp. S165 TaxID=2135462 RepID=UPI000D711431|nr:hypothetical protein [Chitinophaga sp. S165]PWV51917.1 hypothetical protein C7475_103527 [Chitinophaga sp. S165]